MRRRGVNFDERCMRKSYLYTVVGQRARSSVFRSEAIARQSSRAGVLGCSGEDSASNYEKCDGVTVVEDEDQLISTPLVPPSAMGSH